MEKTNKRLYVVAEHVGKDEVKHFLVRAGSQSQAISHVVKGRFEAEAAKTEDVVDLLGAGVVVQDAGSE